MKCKFPVQIKSTTTNNNYNKNNQDIKTFLCFKEILLVLGVFFVD